MSTKCLIFESLSRNDTHVFRYGTAFNVLCSGKNHNATKNDGLLLFSARKDKVFFNQ